MSFFYHPPSEIEWVTLAITALTPVQVKATATKCRGIIIGKPLTGTAEVLVGDVTSQPLRLPIDGDIYYIPIDDASKIYLDVTAGGPFDVGVGIVK